MFSITAVAICIVILFIIIQYLTINSDYWKKRNVKQVNGVLWKFLRGKQSMPEIFKEIYDANPKLQHVGVFLGMTPTLVLRDLQNIQAALHGDFQSFHARGIVTNATDLLTDNLFFIEDYKRWKLQRNKMAPFLTKKQTKNMFYIAERCARDFVDYIESNPRAVDDPYKAMYTYTTACISSTIFGIDKETQNTMETKINQIAYESLKTTVKFNLKFAVGAISPNIYKLLNIKAFGDHENNFINIVKEAIDKRIKDNEVYHDFIDTCLKFSNEGVLKDFVTGYEANATLEFLAAQAFVFLIGGVDTIASVLHFTLIELSHNSDILEKLHNEIDTIFKDNEETITFEDIDKMKYMDMVINETIRMYPPIGVTQRKCCKDTVLPNGNIKIEKGTKLLIPIFALHRDSKYFPEPDTFDPERFSEENMPKIVKNSYIPFGGGKRICVGIQLAYMEMKACLAWLLRKYTLQEYLYKPDHFEPSFFGLRNQKARYGFIARPQR